MNRAPGQGGPALEISGVSKAFTAAGRQIQALDDVSARVGRGRVTGLIGPDSAGKTTLMRIVAGLLLPDQGTVKALDLDVAAQPLAVQAALGYMPQRFGLYEDLTVQENLNLYADLQGLPQAERAGRYAELMKLTNLADFTGRLAGALSGGMKQKLGLACSLVRPKALLLLDEPTVGVDPLSRRELWEIVYRLVEDEGVSVLLSTSYLDEAQRCAEVVLLHQGKVRGQGPPEQFTDELTGRSFQVTVPGLGRRDLQEKLDRSPAVLDAVIHGNGVRIVTTEKARPEPGDLLPGAPDAKVDPVPPRFEDAFVAMLRPQGASQAPPDAGQEAGKNGKADGAVIEVKDLVRRFGDFYAVKGITFHVDRGEVFGLLGANGAGKSTTFRMLCGLLPASSGSLSVAGHNLRRAAAKARSQIGYMAQRFSLYSNLSVVENLTFFASTYGLKNRARQERLEWALDEFELRDQANDPSGELPLGFKQRLALAAALMHSPQILFLDEPTSGVDPLARREFWRRINALAQAGVTVLVTTHFMEEAEYCDRLVIMDQGEILASGTPQEMKERLADRDKPDPTMEEAFISLIEQRQQEKREAA